MTRPELSPESAQILTDKTEDLTTKFGDSIDKVVDILGRRLKAFDIMHTKEGLSADPERLAAISAGLFDKVDSLIFLAEDYRSLATRIRESQPLVTEVEDAVDSYYTKDELDLFAIFQKSDDSAVSAVWILGNGFGLSTSDNYTTRKKLLQKTIASLHDKLSRTEPPMEIIKTGQTRGTRYQLAELAIGATPEALEPTPYVAPVVEALKPEAQAPVTVAAEIAATPVPITPAEPLRYVTRNEGLITPETETALSSAVQSLIDDNETRPILCIGDITLKAFGSGRIEERKYQLVKQVIDQDPRLVQVTKNEYQIVGREEMTDWVDKEELEERVHAFVDDMSRRSVAEESYGRLIRTVGQQRRFLTSLERVEMMNILRAHPQYAAFDGGFVKIDLSKPGSTVGIAPANKPHEHASRGLTNSELNSQLTKLGISGRKQPARRYNPSTKRRQR